MKAYEVVATILGEQTPMTYKPDFYAALEDIEAAIDLHEQVSDSRITLTRVEQEPDCSLFQMEYRFADTKEVFVVIRGTLVDISKTDLEAALDKQNIKARELLSQFFQSDPQEQDHQKSIDEYEALLARIRPTGLPN